MNNNEIEKVSKFIISSEQPIGSKYNRNFDTLIQRAKWLIEECNELIEAAEKKNEVEVLDAIVDIHYINIGNIVTAGMNGVFNEAFDEVHRSNMSKIPADGKILRREDGKIQKPSTYFAPNLEQFLK